MRIEKLKFANINSLQGEWTVDFTKPALAESGLFLITGPTGAGKSSLLDAICLALYGRTPRLAAITSGSNEAMSRQAGYCSSEVIFSTAEGRYRVLWSQHRARKRPGGKLQNPKCEFEDLAEPGLAETRTATVRELVELRTGMTFEQFTRSMLLAQGEFARFLQAKPADRSPILEDITGTEIYTRISRSVHERAVREERIRKELETRLQGVVVLTEKEREEVGLRQAALQDGLQAQEALVAAAREQLAWARQVESERANIDRAREDQKAADEESAGLEPVRQRLDGDARARRLDAPLANLREATRSCTRLETSVTEIGGRLPAAREKVGQACDLLAARTRELEERTASLTELQPVLAAVRELDTKIAQADKERKAADKQVREAARALDDQKDQLEAKRKAILEGREALAASDAELERTACDAALVTELKALEQRLKAHGDLTLRHATLAKAQKKLVGAAAKSAEKLTRASDEKAEAAEALADAQKRRQTLEEERARQLGGLGRDSLSTLFDLVQEAGSVLAEGRAALAGRLAARQALVVEEGKVARLTDTVRELEEGLPLLVQLREKADGLVRARRENLTLQATIRSLEEHRAHLGQGQPCPCCGSLDHPWATGTPAFSVTEQDLDQAELELEACRQAEQKQATDLQTNRGLLEREKTALGEACDREKEAAVREGQALADLLDLGHRVAGAQACLAACRNGSITGRVQEFAEALARVTTPLERVRDGLGEEGRRALDTHAAAAELCLEACGSVLSSVLEAVKTREEALAELNGSLNTLSLEHARLEGEERRLAEAKDRAYKDVETGQKALEESERAVADDHGALAASLAAFGLGEEAVDDDGTASLLATRLANRQNLENERKSQAELLVILEGEQRTLEVGAGQFEAQLEIVRTNLAERTSAWQALCTERHDRFGDRNPDTAEQELRQAIGAADEARTQAAEDRAGAEQALAAEEAALDAARQELDAARTRASDCRAEVDTALAAQGFACEEDVAQARLTEEAKTAMEKSLQTVRDRLVSARTLEDRAREQLAGLVSEGTEKGWEEVTSDTCDRLAEVCAEREAKLAESQRELGVLAERLESDRQNRATFEEVQRRLGEQKILASRWRDLDTLVGSADGKKFRNYAQSLTFVRLIRCANEEMQNLTDRYLLARDPENPLEFQVIDRYQANERRSIKNLSGGETFLVSLALALGLSSLSGGKVHIETMFLDEGFGTLDPDALDSAISTLSGLRDRGTALIGIISHVEALQERIETQLVLSRGGNGISSLSGPGVEP